MTSISIFGNSSASRFAAISIITSLAIHVLFPAIACGKVEKIDFYKEFQKSDVVLIGEIVAKRENARAGKLCATVYTVSATNVVKGNSFLKPADIDIGRTDGLVLRGRYLLFLTYKKSSLEEYEDIKKRLSLPDQNESDKAKILDLIQCNSVIPGLIFDPQIAFNVSSNFIVVDGLKPQLPEMVEVKSGGTLTWVVNVEDLLGYLVSMHEKE